mmetsp:Transcript_27164/g.58218  ORF Transcript_27164/g.58218 Transcript_27164/m.58218 type:complete len:215 (-) Transcript_27164:1115-1759(-)
MKCWHCKLLPPFIRIGSFLTPCHLGLLIGGSIVGIHGHGSIDRNGFRADCWLCCLFSLGVIVIAVSTVIVASLLESLLEILLVRSRCRALFVHFIISIGRCILHFILAIITTVDNITTATTDDVRRRHAIATMAQRLQQRRGILLRSLFSREDIGRGRDCRLLLLVVALFHRDARRSAGGGAAILLCTPARPLLRHNWPFRRRWCCHGDIAAYR